MERLDICKNFLVEGKCDSWIRSRFKNDEFVGGLDDDIGGSDQEITDEICSDCPNFERERGIIFSDDG